LKDATSGYLEVFPSKQPSVRHLGRALAEFLRRREDIPKCLADLAQLEWARVEVFDAPDAESATMGDCVSVSAGRLAGFALLDDSRTSNFARSISRSSTLVR